MLCIPRWTQETAFSDVVVDSGNGGDYLGILTVTVLEFPFVRVHGRMLPTVHWQWYTQENKNPASLISGKYFNDQEGGTLHLLLQV